MHQPNRWYFKINNGERITVKGNSLKEGLENLSAFFSSEQWAAILLTGGVNITFLSSSVVAYDPK